MADKPAPSRADFVRKPLDRLKRAVVRTMNVAMGHRTDAEIRAAFDMPGNEAPLWAKSVTTLATQVIRTESDKGASINNNLNLVMLERSESNAAWLGMVRAALPVKAPGAIAAAPEIIDVPAVPVVVVVKK